MATSSHNVDTQADTLGDGDECWTWHDMLAIEDTKGDTNLDEIHEDAKGDTNLDEVHEDVKVQEDEEIMTFQCIMRGGHGLYGERELHFRHQCCGLIALPRRFQAD